MFARLLQYSEIDDNDSSDNMSEVASEGDASAEYWDVGSGDDDDEYQNTLSFSIIKQKICYSNCLKKNIR